MFKKVRLFIFMATLVLTLYHPPTASAGQVILNDKYQNINYVDMTKTTAYVDTTNGYVCLPQQATPNAIAMMQYGYGYTISTVSGINAYNYDDAAGKMAQNPAQSIPLVTNAIGIAVRQDIPNTWVLTNNSLTLYKFNGSQMATNPNLQATGLNNMLSVSSWSNADKAAVLSSSGTVTVYDASSGSLVISATFNTGLSDPVAVSVVAGTPDLVVATGSAFYYYAYDDATGNYILDTTRQGAGLNGVMGVSSQQTGTATLTNSAVNYYLQNDASGYQSETALSASPISNPVAVSVKPGTYDYAVLTHSGQVKYYTYDDLTNTEIENTSLETNVSLVNTGYLHPKDYYSTVINTGSKYNTVSLTVTENLPSGTSVAWYVSSDGGNTWTSITSGTWILIQPGNQFVVHAVLDTTNTSVTPKITEVVLTVNTIIGINLSPTSLSVTAQDDPTTHTLITQFIGSLSVSTITSDGQNEQDITNSVTWNSSNFNVAYVSGPGQVYNGPYAGTATITAFYSLLNLTSNPCTVTVTADIPPSGISNFIQNYRREIG